MSERNPGEITGYSVALVSGSADQLAAARTSGGAPLFFSGAFLACGIALARRPERRAQGAAMAGVALGFFLLVLGYGIGKDLALRDNARANAPAAAP